METEKIKSKADEQKKDISVEMDKEKIKNLIEDAKSIGICFYKKVISDIIEGKIKPGDICYVASTPSGYNYNGFEHNTTRAYTYDDDGNGFSLLFSDLKNHRAQVAVANYEKYKNGEIPNEVWDNYTTNGRSTRAGLFRSKVNKDILLAIARSHADFSGNETGDSTQDHKMRAQLRNKFLRKL